MNIVPVNVNLRKIWYTILEGQFVCVCIKYLMKMNQVLIKVAHNVITNKSVHVYMKIGQLYHDLILVLKKLILLYAYI